PLRSFKEIIAPISTEQFFGTYWERKPLLVKRNSPSHYDDWFSTADFDSMLRNHRVMFGEHLDVTSYRDGKRETHNPEGARTGQPDLAVLPVGLFAAPPLSAGVSRSRLSKAEHSARTVRIFVGANVYLTPPGFAPHWDDIEAFVMQLEGRKHWRVYAPRSPNERLPREKLWAKDRLGQPVIDAVLEPGDLLLHVPALHSPGPLFWMAGTRCISPCHLPEICWTDLLAEAISGALERATTQDEEFRRGLPLGLLGFAGSAFGSLTAASRDDWANRRREAEEFCRSLLARLSGHISLDEAADRIACGQ
uniref:Bifunctional lysine-specific demethylase and histidyl-hydroxylase n=1 Tax=Macrostomum lignano TaxID=282301 RepID=A0A1I8I8V5_9PLAT